MPNSDSTERTLTPQFPTFALNRRRIGVLAVLGLLSVVLLLSLGGGRTALAALAHVNWTLVGLAILIHYSGFAVRGLRWQHLLRLMGHRLPWWRVTALLVSGWFISALLPARAGDVARVAVLRLPTRTAQPVAVADSLGSIVLERVLDIVAILVLGALFGFALLRGALPTWVLTAYAVGLTGLLLFGGTLLLAPALLSRLRSWSSNNLWQSALNFILQLINSLRTLSQAPWTAFLLVVASLYIWLCDALLMWLAVWSLGQLLPFGQMAFVALTVDIFATVPLTPGGVGQIETVNAALLALLQLPTASVAAAVLVNRAVSYWSFLLFSGIVTFASGVGQLLAGHGLVSPRDDSE